jgi:protein-S-isoprenylcysteine O-methyltransferase Ste14
MVASSPLAIAGPRTQDAGALATVAGSGYTGAVGWVPERTRRRTVLSTVGSAVWFVLGAGTGALLVPWVLTGWHVAYPSWAGWRVVQALGVLLVVAGLAPIVWTFVCFVRAGGTPIPGVYTQQLVVSGFNRYVRNPIYVGVIVNIVGQAMVLGQWVLLVYAGCLWLGTAAFVRLYEEPALAQRFGTSYEDYRRAVPAWRPRRRPWSGR